MTQFWVISANHLVANLEELVTCYYSLQGGQSQQSSVAFHVYIYMSAYRKTCQHYYCTSNPSSRERNCNPASLLKGVASIPHREKLGATYFQYQRRVWASSSHAEIYNTKYAPTHSKSPTNSTAHGIASSHPKTPTATTARLHLMLLHVAPQPLITRRNVWRDLQSTWLSSAKHKLKDRTLHYGTP